MDFEFKGGYSRMTGCTVENHPEYDRGFRNGQQIKQAEIDALKAELAKYQQEGYKLVPVEPTKAMQQSAFDVYEVCDYKNYHLNSGTEVRDMIYKAMIGAAE